MNLELNGRLTPLDSNRRFSKLGVFKKVDGNQDYICFEKVATSDGEVTAYMIRTPENEEFVNRQVTHGDIVNLNGSYQYFGGERIFVANSGKILSKCKSGRRSDIFDLSSKVREAVRLRSDILKSVRQYFSDNGFMEITTPILLPFYEGGDADPFITLDKDKRELFLKETNELILRRLISCCVGPVYEIGKSFRNIGTNQNSTNEFSVVESAMPYVSLAEGIDFAEGILKNVLRNFSFDELGVDNPWKRLKFEEGYKKATGQEYSPKRDYIEDRKDLSRVLDLIDDEPTFIIGLPNFISPINSVSGNTLNESVLVINRDVYCDICSFEISKKSLEERLSQQQKRTNRSSASLLKFADYGFVPGVGIAFGLERWMKLISGKDITELRNLGGII